DKDDSAAELHVIASKPEGATDPRSLFPKQVRWEDVPRFDGHPSSWPHFSRLFEDVVGNNPNVTDNVKLDFLSRAIPDFTQSVLSYESWQSALAGLGARFTRASVLINDLLRMASEVPTITDSPSDKDWRKFEQNIECLKRR